MESTSITAQIISNSTGFSCPFMIPFLAGSN
jgi:hypothetical protein